MLVALRITLYCTSHLGYVPTSRSRHHGALDPGPSSSIKGGTHNYPARGSLKGCMLPSSRSLGQDHACERYKNHRKPLDSNVMNKRISFSPLLISVIKPHLLRPIPIFYFPLSFLTFHRSYSSIIPPFNALPRYIHHSSMSDLRVNGARLPKLLLLQQ